MARRSIDQRIAELEEQAKALKARKSETDRANDTRRKVILGTMLMQGIEGDGETSKLLRNWLAQELPGQLTRDHDREIFAELLTKISRSDDA
ncbi:mobilization protein [Agrobacterium tumefaciens]|uniref:mobilization protein n=1 Tax=Agrobacterium tumefaciens TaxID=358 RepID=UPI00157175D2|nr:mobilization protein [Agrobacterium tumefaciens]NTD85730.1 mobilization protein [Agrobacterium tumefaciens]NTD89718.1 mobilization protein [Agrobacterium tumefaciens]NTE21999.1 mobilization protein [Agrobacterium tumefaciens]NTE31649.1 mobilization protein [Agrobacterium tumefaciens]NTE41892.1 mobilization protein [Agrobacterium tumefaciens]